MIITGAPVEKLQFEEVDYWNELVEIFDWAHKHVTSTLYICWAALAGLYHFYGIPKYPLDKKLFGVFAHHKYDERNPFSEDSTTCFTFLTADIPRYAEPISKRINP